MNLLDKVKMNKISNSVFVSALSGKLIFGRTIPIINIFSLLVSWYVNKSIFWGIFHYIFGFWYLIYSLLMQRFNDGGIMDIINYYF